MPYPILRLLVATSCSTLVVCAPESEALEQTEPSLVPSPKSTSDCEGQDCDEMLPGTELAMFELSPGEGGGRIAARPSGGIVLAGRRPSGDAHRVWLGSYDEKLNLQWESLGVSDLRDYMVDVAVAFDGRVLVSATRATEASGEVWLGTFGADGTLASEHEFVDDPDQVEAIVPEENGDSVILAKSGPDIMPKLQLVRIGSDGQIAWRTDLELETAILCRSETGLAVAGHEIDAATGLTNAVVAAYAGDGTLRWRHEVAEAWAQDVACAPTSGAVTAAVNLDSANAASPMEIISFDATGQVAWAHLLNDNAPLRVAQSRDDEVVLVLPWQNRLVGLDTSGGQSWQAVFDRRETETLADVATTVDSLWIVTDYIDPAIGWRGVIRQLAL